MIGRLQSKFVPFMCFNNDTLIPLFSRPILGETCLTENLLSNNVFLQYSCRYNIPSCLFLAVLRVSCFRTKRALKSQSRVSLFGHPDIRSGRYERTVDVSSIQVHWTLTASLRTAVSASTLGWKREPIFHRDASCSALCATAILASHVDRSFWSYL